MNDNDRIMLTKLNGANVWCFISNPRWDTTTKALSAVLANEFNDYAEYQNCGCVNRMIRARDAENYGVAGAPRLSVDNAEAYELVGAKRSSNMDQPTAPDDYYCKLCRSSDCDGYCDCPN